MTKAEAQPLLNESQRRRLSITLAGLERDVLRLKDALAHPPEQGVLARYSEPLPTGHAEEVAEIVSKFQQKIRVIAEDLAFEPHEEPTLPRHLAVLTLASIALHEVDSKRLRGYGKVEPATTEYLNRELPQLQRLLAQLGTLLNSAGRKGQ